MLAATRLVNRDGWEKERGTAELPCHVQTVEKVKPYEKCTHLHCVKAYFIQGRFGAVSAAAPISASVINRNDTFFFTFQR